MMRALNGPNVAGSSGIVGQNLNIVMGVAGSVAGGSGANAITFTGGANTLTFSKATTGLSGNIDVTGSLTFDQSGIDTTVGNVITGGGSVVKTGTHAITLSGANSYTGGTTINGGTCSRPSGDDNRGDQYRRAGVRRRHVTAADGGFDAGEHPRDPAARWRRRHLRPRLNTTVCAVLTGTGGLTQDRRRHGHPLRRQHLCGRHRHQWRHPAARRRRQRPARSLGAVAVGVAARVTFDPRQRRHQRHHQHHERRRREFPQQHQRRHRALDHRPARSGRHLGPDHGGMTAGSIAGAGKATWPRLERAQRRRQQLRRRSRRHPDRRKCLFRRHVR